MSDTYHAINLHFVFGTKSRTPLITDEIRVELFLYIGGVARANDSTLFHAGGVEDHVHLLIGLPPKLAASDLMRDVKANSSRWMKERWELEKFAWQDGFSVFSVSPSKLKATIEYLDGQREHHAKVSFGRELRDMYDALWLTASEQSIRTNRRS